MSSLQVDAVVSGVQAWGDFILTTVLVGVTGYYAFTVQKQLDRMLRSERRPKIIALVDELLLYLIERVREIPEDVDIEMVLDTSNVPNPQWDIQGSPNLVPKLVAIRSVKPDEDQHVHFAINPETERIEQLLSEYNDHVAVIRENAHGFALIMSNWGAAASSSAYPVGEKIPEDEREWMGGQWVDDLELALDFTHGDLDIDRYPIWEDVLDYYFGDPPDAVEDLPAIRFTYFKFIFGILQYRIVDNPDENIIQIYSLWTSLISEAENEGHSYYREADENFDTLADAIVGLRSTRNALENELDGSIRALSSEYHLYPDELENEELFKKVLSQS